MFARVSQGYVVQDPCLPVQLRQQRLFRTIYAQGNQRVAVWSDVPNGMPLHLETQNFHGDPYWFISQVQQAEIRIPHMTYLYGAQYPESLLTRDTVHVQARF